MDGQNAQPGLRNFKGSEKTLQELRRSNGLEQIRLYYPKLDLLANHGPYDLLTELKLLQLMSHIVILPPSHIVENSDVISRHIENKTFLDLIESPGVITTIHENHRDSDDFLAERQVKSKDISHFLRRIKFEHRVTYTQSRVLRHVFHNGLVNSHALQQRLVAGSESSKVGKKLADSLYEKGQDERIVLTRGDVLRWCEDNATPAVSEIVKLYIDYCYYYAGAVGNDAIMVDSPFFSDRELLPALRAYGFNQAYNPLIFKMFLNELGIENRTIQNLRLSDIQKIRQSPAHNDFVWLYYRLTKEAMNSPDDVLSLLREYYRCHDLTFKSILGRRLQQISCVTGTTATAVGAFLGGIPWIVCGLVVMGGLCYYIGNWKDPPKPRSVQHLIDIFYGARWPMSILVDKLKMLQIQRQSRGDL